LQTAINYIQSKYNTSRHLLKTSLHYRAKHKKFKVHLLYQFLMTKLCETFIISLWIVNQFEKHILRIWNIAVCSYFGMTVHSHSTHFSYSTSACFFLFSQLRY